MQSLILSVLENVFCEYHVKNVFLPTDIQLYLAQDVI